MSKRLEVATNVVMIVVAIIAGVLLVRNLMFRPRTTPMPPPIATGTALAVPGLDWHTNGKTLVLAVSTNCRYCSESAPFYRRLADEVQRRHVHLTALLPQAADEGAQYLRGLEVPIVDIRSAPLKSLKIRGTPTLLLIDDRGIVRQVWEGKLSTDGERQVIAAL
jgi:hypothetical protein